MADLIIYGNGRVAELTYSRLVESTTYNVLGFVVDRDYIHDQILLGLPVVAFDEVSTAFPPTEVEAMMGIGHVKLNRIRAERYQQMKALGYRFITYISPTATVSSQASIGDGCSIGDGVFIDPHVTIGENVRVATRCAICHHTTIGDHCFLSVNVVTAGNVEIEPYATVGTSATLRDDIRVGKNCVIGAGAILMVDAPADSVWVGPAAEKLPISSNRLPSID